MSDTKSPTDLSLDEILATMRRIIDEDEHAPAAPQPPTAAASPASEPTAEDGERRDGEQQGGAPDDAAATRPGGGSDGILELTEALNEDGTVRHLSPIGFIRPHRAAEPVLPESDTDEGPSKTGAVRREPLLSEASAAATAAAFEQLSTIPRGAEAPAGPRVGDRPLDEIVAQLLQPLLRTWLDNNLPAIVERLVQREIDRAISRSEPD